MVFDGAWGVSPLITIIPDSKTWDRRVPVWLRGRHAEVTARLRGHPDHVIREGARRFVVGSDARRGDEVAQICRSALM